MSTAVKEKQIRQPGQLSGRNILFYTIEFLRNTLLYKFLYKGYWIKYQTYVKVLFY